QQPGRRQDRFAGLLDADAAEGVAHAQLQVSGHERAAVLLGDRLEVAQDRLDLAGGHGHAGKLTGRQQTFTREVSFHWSLTSPIPGRAAAPLGKKTKYCSILSSSSIKSAPKPSRIS